MHFSRHPADLDEPGETSRLFDLPDRPVSAVELLEFDVILYSVGAGVQAREQIAPVDLYYANAAYPLRLLSELEAAGYRGRWISFGSYFEIGEGASSPETELGVLNSRHSVPNAYCDSKRVLSRVLAYGRWRASVHHFILPSLYGAGEDSARLIPHVLASLRSGDNPPLSAGTQVRQYLHVSDVAQLLVKVISGGVPPGIFNLAPTTVHSVREVVQLVFDVSGSSRPPQFGALKTRDQSMQYLALDGAALLGATGWRPEVGLREGIEEYCKPHVADRSH